MVARQAKISKTFVEIPLNSLPVLFANLPSEAMSWPEPSQSDQLPHGDKRGILQILRQIRNATSGLRGCFSRLIFSQQHLAPCWRQFTRNNLRQSCFPRTIGPYQADEFPGGKSGRNVPENGLRSSRKGHAVQFYAGLHPNISRIIVKSASWPPISSGEPPALLLPGQPVFRQA